MLAAALFAGLSAPVRSQSFAPLAGTQPLRFDHSASQIRSTCSEELSRAKRSVLAIATLAPGAATFTNAALALENASADRNDALAAERFLRFVSGDPAVRAASLKCVRDIRELDAEFAAQPALYRVLLDAQRSNTTSTDADRKLLELELDAYRRSGAALSAASRLQYIKLARRLALVQTAFRSTLAADRRSIAITAGQAAGLPADLVAAFAPAPGGFRVPVSDATYSSFMKNEPDGQARRAFYVAYMNRGGQRNVRRLQEALSLRYRIARIMGYASWDDFVLADRMAKAPSRVETTLDVVANKLEPVVVRELAELRARKAKVTGDQSVALDEWDRAYYANEIARTEHPPDEGDVASYFPARQTVERIMALYSRLLGVGVVADPAAALWSPDVTAFRVSDTASGAVLGTLYLDLFSRPGKITHAGAVTLLPARVATGSRPAIVAVLANLPAPTVGSEPTLAHAEVAAFFRELGQSFGALLAQTPYETLNSASRWDFDEAPGEMFERWAWDRSILKTLSANVVTGRPLPDATIDRLIATKNAGSASYWLSNITLARIDLAFHADVPHVDTGVVWRTQFEATPFPMIPAGVVPQAGFVHMVSGYDAGYYGYVWSKVYADDLFSAFAAGGLQNADLGMRYRRDVLEPGRTNEPDIAVERFLGRALSTTPFLRDVASADDASL